MYAVYMSMYAMYMFVYIAYVCIYIYPAGLFALYMKVPLPALIYSQRVTFDTLMMNCMHFRYIRKCINLLICTCVFQTHVRGFSTHV